VPLANRRFARFRHLWVVTLVTLVCSSLPLLSRPLYAIPTQQQASPASSSGIIAAGALVNLRGGPGPNYLVLAKLDPGTAVAVLSIHATQEWVRVRVNETGRTGWVAAELIQFAPAPVQTVLLPTPTPDPELRTSTVAQPAVAAAAPAQNPVEAPQATTSAGAIAADVVTAEEAVELAAVAPSGPTAIIQPASMNVRGGPGTNYGVVTTVRSGAALPILAVGPNGDWYKVQLDGQPEAWIAASLARTSGGLDGLPRLAADEVPAPPVAAAAPAAPALAAAAPASGDAPPPAGGGFFAYGIQAHLWQHGEKGAIAGQVRDIGFTWVKAQVRWEFAEDHPGHVNWHEMDQIVEVMHGNGVNVLFSIVTAPQWTRPDKPGTGGPPNDFNVFAAFVGNVAARYCGRLGAIEVWNEQNLQREWEGFPLDPALYMDLLRRSYSAIKNNCPSILVISGAPTPSGNSPVAVDDVDYLRGMYAHGLAAYSDGVGVHPSGFAHPPEVTVQDWQAGRYTPPPSHFDHRSFYFRSTMEEYRSVMVANGDVNKRLWPTEFGWGSSSTPFPGYEYQAYITESMQAQYIVRAYLLMREWGWVGVPFLWNLNYSEGEMAMFRVAGRPAYEALKSLPK
jgi:uncharacterized protein YgiM (DUF1202 family)